MVRLCNGHNYMFFLIAVLTAFQPLFLFIVPRKDPKMHRAVYNTAHRAFVKQLGLKSLHSLLSLRLSLVI